MNMFLSKSAEITALFIMYDVNLADFNRNYTILPQFMKATSAQVDQHFRFAFIAPLSLIWPMSWPIDSDLSIE